MQHAEASSISLWSAVNLTEVVFSQIAPSTKVCSISLQCVFFARSLAHSWHLTSFVCKCASAGWKPCSQQWLASLKTLASVFIWRVLPGCGEPVSCMISCHPTILMIDMMFSDISVRFFSREIIAAHSVFSHFGVTVK